MRDMSTRTASDSHDPIVENRDQLAAPMIKGEKPRDRWRIGTEHEKFVYRTADHRAPSYDAPGGIHDLLMALTRFGWEPVVRSEARRGGTGLVRTGRYRWS